MPPRSPSSSSCARSPRYVPSSPPPLLLSSPCPTQSHPTRTNPHTRTRAPQAWAISISATILQNALRTRLPAAFLALIPPGHDIAYSAIPLIPTLAPAPLQAAVRAAFADSMRLVWRVLLAFAGAGLLSVLLQRDVALHGKMDRRWGMKEGKGGKGGKESKEGAAEEGEGEGALDAEIGRAHV